MRHLGINDPKLGFKKGAETLLCIYSVQLKLYYLDLKLCFKNQGLCYYSKRYLSRFMRNPKSAIKSQLLSRQGVPPDLASSERLYHETYRYRCPPWILMSFCISISDSGSDPKTVMGYDRDWSAKPLRSNTCLKNGHGAIKKRVRLFRKTPMPLLGATRSIKIWLLGIGFLLFF